MTKNKMYVWRIGEHKDGGLYTVASKELRELDLARYNKIKKDDNIELYAFIQYLSKTYLTKYKGDISISEYASYEDCMRNINQKGHDIKFESHEAPTQH
tara:strand:+ start:788 stop:1084 length:297 start_codon:yes stop_codon:yes gene_type:complete